MLSRLVLLLLLVIPCVSQATLPANEIWRENLLNYRVGYGAAATGGAGGTLCTVSNLNDSGAGSLRNCLSQSGPQWVIFSVSGTITLATDIHMHGFAGNIDKTIDGRGQTITLSSSAGALLLNDVSNWIIHDITITNVNGFPLRMIGGTHTIWIDHLDMTGSAADNLVTLAVGAEGGDNQNASTNITISWSHFHNKGIGSGMVLIGSDPSSSMMVDSNVTLHHNWYERSDVRHPLMRWGKTHSFNNFFDNDDIGAQVRTHGRFNSENDIFQCDAYGGSGQCGFSGITTRVECDYVEPGGAVADNCKVTAPWLVTGTETYQQLNAGTTFNPASEYSYTLDTANAALRTALLDTTTGTGAVPNPYGSVNTFVPTILRVLR